MKHSQALKNNVLAQLKGIMDGGSLRLFAGTVPATAEEALDMVATHTELAHITVGGSGGGLTFETPTAGVLTKTPGEQWKGTYVFDGAQEAEESLAPTFYRFCAAGDNGRGIADGSTGYRLQGTMGGPSSAAELRIGVSTATNGNEQPIGDFIYRLPNY